MRLVSPRFDLNLRVWETSGYPGAARLWRAVVATFVVIAALSVPSTALAWTTQVFETASGHWVLDARRESGDWTGPAVLTVYCTAYGSEYGNSSGSYDETSSGGAWYGVSPYQISVDASSDGADTDLTGHTPGCAAFMLVVNNSAGQLVKHCAETLEYAPSLVGSYLATQTLTVSASGTLPVSVGSTLPVSVAGTAVASVIGTVAVSNPSLSATNVAVSSLPSVSLLGTSPVTIQGVGSSGPTALDALAMLLDACFGLVAGTMVFTWWYLKHSRRGPAG
jgi:hypothetical protein